MGKEQLPKKSDRADVDAFLAEVAKAPAPRTESGRGRLIFAMDATASREPSWDRACHIQAEMFEQTARLGGLDVQLCYYRGYGEFKHSPWVGDPQLLLAEMTATRCVGGFTQIDKLLKHAAIETRRQAVNALVFVGDAMEENVDQVCNTAGRLGLLKLPVFMFQEGNDATAEQAFRQIAQLTRGAYCRFDANSADQLRDLLSAVAVYAAGGRRALDDFNRKRGGKVLQLTAQLD
jgi:hypothetical protein